MFYTRARVPTTLARPQGGPDFTVFELLARNVGIDWENIHIYKDYFRYDVVALRFKRLIRRPTKRRMHRPLTLKKKEIFLNLPSK